MLQTGSDSSKSDHIVDKAQLEKDITEYSGQIMYSKRYSDDHYEYRYRPLPLETVLHVYRHVILPKQLAKYIPTSRLMEESEWRAIGVTQSPGWVHYMIHAPEPHILLFKRVKD